MDPTGVRLLDAGDGAVTVQFGERIAPELVSRVAAFEQAVDAARARGGLPGVIEAMPTFRSLTLLYDPLRTDRAHDRWDDAVTFNIDREEVTTAVTRPPTQLTIG